MSTEMSQLGRAPQPSAGRTWAELTPVWTSLAIAAMWMAVAVAAAFGGDIVSSGGSAGANGTTSIPSAIPVALLACIGTAFAARYGLRDDT